MRKHGWQLPYHPLQVVAIAVFLALGFAFYVFFVPFVGRKQYQYVVVGLYTPLVLSVFSLYIWCAAANPADPGVFKSKKKLGIVDSDKYACEKNPELSKNVVNTDTLDEEISPKEVGKKNISCCITYLFLVLFAWCPFSWIWIWPCSQEHSLENQSTEDGMFYCNLCEVQVYKYSKHCRVCDKCVDGFDHHCRWLNNCIGKQNYRRFFILMVSSLLLLILQWSIGVFVLVRCFIERKSFNADIAAKLGSSFSLVPFVVVVVSCTLLAMVATLPLAQLFFFHVLLLKKGLSTYDYIIALREQEQQGLGGQHSPQMTPLSSVTGLSSASSFNTFQRAAWCTPPRLFVDDQFDVIPPETGLNKRMPINEHSKKKAAGMVKISPWALARLNAEEVSKAAAQARKKSKVLQPVVRKKSILSGQETDSSFSSKSEQMSSKIDHRRRFKKGKFPTDLPCPQTSASENNASDLLSAVASTSLAPLQLEARTAFHTSAAMLTGTLASSPDSSSLQSPDTNHPFRVSSSIEEAQGFPYLGSASQKCIELSSDGYDASGGEDSDRVPSRIVHRSSNWSNLLIKADDRDVTDRLRASSYPSNDTKVNNIPMF